MKYHVKLPFFEGPFDLLFHLIQKQEIDIWSISISQITEQYLEHLQLMEELNLEVTSEFLVMAAALLRLKSKLLLPGSSSLQEEGEMEELFPISSTEELVRRVLEYRLYKGAAFFLQEKEKEQQKIFFRTAKSPRVLNLPRQETIFSQGETANTLASLLQEMEERAFTVDPGYTFSVMEEYDLRKKMDRVLGKLEEVNQPLFFDSFLETGKTSELLTLFFAMLELAYQKKIKIYQEKDFGPIIIEKAFS